MLPATIERVPRPCLPLRMLARLFQPRKEIWDVFDGASWVGTISASTRREAVQLLQSFPRRETLQLLSN